MFARHKLIRSSRKYTKKGATDSNKMRMAVYRKKIVADGE